VTLQSLGRRTHINLSLFERVRIAVFCLR